MPKADSYTPISKTEFSTENALTQLSEISKAPHFLGSSDHERVRLYLISHLRSMGLEVDSQIGFVLQEDKRSLVKPKNIIARIKGSDSKNSLLLVSHYDSAKVPSLGASDTGSGIVTILEGIRAYLARRITPKNDIVILFTDSEEIGLDGAKLFINEHPWAKNARLALNFEARGTGGPSNMILETNQGNANLIKSFIDANPSFPVSSSLMYSIYKMLPNDTDSTIFREDGDIDSFFFAFIDDHFDYHTSRDTIENLDVNSLQHQQSYFVPLLDYFADADLSTLKSEEDFVYTNLPIIKMIAYPFSWISWMLILAVLLFIGLLYYGISIGKLTGISIMKGAVALLISLISCGLMGFFAWDILTYFYPHYSEIQQGFTYNGHVYIALFVFLSLSILFAVYYRFTKKAQVTGIFVAPLTIWIIINVLIFLYLKGAGYFIIPIYFGLISFWLLLRDNKPNLLLLTLLTAPAIFLFAPLIKAFTVGLGLKMLVISCVFTALCFFLLVPVFGFYKQKRLLSILCLLIGIALGFRSHSSSSFSVDRQKPNSLVYYQDLDKGNSYWVTYDSILDEWTKGYLGNDPEDARKYISNVAGSKYNTGYSYSSKTTHKDLLVFDVSRKKDTIIDANRNVTFTIHPKRDIHQLTLYTDTTHVFYDLTFNGKSAIKDTTGIAFSNRTSNLFLSYYVTDTDSLEISYTLKGSENVEFTCLEYSFDLLEHPQFSMSSRDSTMMPKPFVNTDAIVIKKSFVIDSIYSTGPNTSFIMENSTNE